MLRKLIGCSVKPRADYAGGISRTNKGIQIESNNRPAINLLRIGWLKCNQDGDSVDASSRLTFTALPVYYSQSVTKVLSLRQNAKNNLAFT